MREYIINIHPNELLHKKLNSLELMKIKKITKKWTIYNFYLTILLQEFLKN